MNFNPPVVPIGRNILALVVIGTGATRHPAANGDSEEADRWK